MRLFYVRMRQTKDEEQVSDENMLYRLGYRDYKDEKLVDFYERWIKLKDKNTPYNRYSQEDFRDMLWRKIKDADSKLLAIDVEHYKRNKDPSEPQYAATCTLGFLEKAFQRVIKANKSRCH